MTNKLAALTGAYFDSIGLPYEFEGDDKGIIITGSHKTKNLPAVEVVFIFDKVGYGVRALIPAFVMDIPAERTVSMYETVNKANSYFRWAKFYICDDRSIMVDTDALLDPSSCGEECHAILTKLVEIADAAYPLFNKEIWK